MDATAEFQDRLNQVAKDIDLLLDRLLGHDPQADEVGRPPRLLEAMRYASLGAGKRFRPFLVAESAALFGVARQHALMAGAALECVHCYSLVHDDMPAMDNDELRRGQPTVHKAFEPAHTRSEPRTAKLAVASNHPARRQRGRSRTASAAATRAHERARSAATRIPET